MIIVIKLSKKVNYYGSSKAVEMYLVFGSNLMTAENIPYFVKYTATMAGMAGILGAIAIPLIIGVVFKGETMAAVGLLNAVKGLYAGNTLENAKRDLTRQRANQIAEKQEAEMYAEAIDNNQIEWLNKHGFFPQNSAEAARMYAQLQSEIAQLAGGFAAARAFENGGDGEFYQGSNLQATKQIATTKGYGKEMRIGRTQVEALEVAETSGDLAGAAAARSDIGTVDAVNAEGRDLYLQGIENQALNNTASIAKYGTLSREKALRDGELSGLQKAANASYRADHLKDSDAIALGEFSGLNELASAQKLKNSKIADKETGHMDHRISKDGGADKYLDGALDKGVSSLAILFAIVKSIERHDYTALAVATAVWSIYSLYLLRKTTKEKEKFV